MSETASVIVATLGLLALAVTVAFVRGSLE